MQEPAPKPPAAHVEWAKYLRSKVPGDAIHVRRHYDDAEQHAIAIFTSENAHGVVAATVGVMEVDQRRGEGPPLATEILLDARGRRPYAADVLATVAFFILKDGWRVRPGVTFADIIPMYAPELRVKHMLFTPAFQWQEGMTRVTLTDRTIYPLLAVPITDEELELVKSRGADVLEERWIRSSTDVLDWSREGVV